MEGPTRVVVLGHGTAGAELITALDKISSIELTVVDPRGEYYSNPAAVRGVIDAEFAESLWIPLGGILKRGKHIQAKAIGVDTEAKHVLLPQDLKQPYDILVIATGSNYGSTLASQVFRPTVAKQEALEANRELQAKLFNASEVVILGGGTVGVETAPELKAAMPDKKITLVHKGPRLISADPMVTEKTSAALLEDLRAAGVEVHLSSSLVHLDEEEGRGTITTDLLGTEANVSEKAVSDVHTPREAGLPEDVDVGPGAYVLKCFGARPNTSFLAESKLSASINPQGYINVDRFLRVQGFKDVFAIGDVIAEERTVIGVALLSGKVAAKNIVSLVKNPGAEKKLKAFSVPNMMLSMIISTGPQQTGEATSLMSKMFAPLKKKNMMVPMTAARLKAPKAHKDVAGPASGSRGTKSPRRAQAAK